MCNNAVLCVVGFPFFPSRWVTLVIHNPFHVNYHSLMVDMEYTSHRIALAARIKSLREQQRFSTRKFSMMIGISKTHLYKVETAQSSPTFDMLERMAAGLDVPVHELVYFDDDRPRDRQ